MKSGNLGFFIGIILLLLIDGILWLQIRQSIQKLWIKKIYIFQVLFFIILLIIFHCSVKQIKGANGYFWMEQIIGLLILIYSPKTIYILFNGLASFCKNWNYRISKQLKRIGMGLSVILFFYFIYCFTLGRYQYKVEQISIPIQHLTAPFQDFKIVQISDLHVGSFCKNDKAIPQLVKTINALQPDLIVFTGDMINNFSTEILPWIQTLRKLKAPYGKYAVTGNHDYGNYTLWNHITQKQENYRQFLEYMNQAGFQMLNNTHIPIVSHQDTLWLAGIVDETPSPLPQPGNLQTTLYAIPANQPIILLAHNPILWKSKILNYPVQLTLSGHTHAMQFGIEIGQFKWSPAQYLYQEYDGLYQEGTRYLYINRGQGYLGIPGRIGLQPEITLLILKMPSMDVPYSPTQL